METAQTFSVDEALNSYNGKAVFTAFDIETTGLDPKQDRIVEIGAVKFDKRGIIARFSSLINPEIPMPKEAGEINNISDEMLAGQPLIENALPDFLFFCSRSIIIAHNAPFDCGFIKENLKRLSDAAEIKTARSSWIPPFPSLPNQIADTRLLAKEAFPGLASYSLQKIAAEFKIPAIDAHRAEDDARLCMEVFLICINRQ